MSSSKLHFIILVVWSQFDLYLSQLFGVHKGTISCGETVQANFPMFDNLHAYSFNIESTAITFTTCNSSFDTVLYYYYWENNDWKSYGPVCNTDYAPYHGSHGICVSCLLGTNEQYTVPTLTVNPENHATGYIELDAWPGDSGNYQLTMLCNTTVTTNAPTTAEPSIMPTLSPTPGAVDIIGMTTSDDIIAGSPATITLILWFNFIIYECILFPTQINTTYSCTSSQFTVIGASNCNTPEAKIMIDNAASTDAIIIKNIFVTTINSVTYGIEQFCISNALYTGPHFNTSDWKINDNECGTGNTHYKYICVDNEISDCGPAKQLLFFDLNQPNVYITNSVWNHGTDVSTDVVTCAPTTSNPTATPTTTTPTTTTPTTTTPTTIAPTPVRYVSTIGFTTSDDAISNSPATITLKLWFNFTIYECFLFPANINTTYSCNYSQITAIGSYNYSNCNTPTKIIIDNSASTDAIILKNVFFVTTVNSIIYGIEGFCINDGFTKGDRFTTNNWTINDNQCDVGSTHYQYICVDNEVHDCSPAKQLLYFDASRPNIYITDSIWKHGTDVSIHDKITCDPTTSPTTTNPTTDEPTTNEPTTMVPTTNEVIVNTPEPTIYPVTVSPTTSLPTTISPTTWLPTTTIPSVIANPPTKSPTKTPTSNPFGDGEVPDGIISTTFQFDETYLKNENEDSKGLNINAEYVSLYIGSFLLFIIIIAYIYGKYAKPNDFFRVVALITASLHILDMVSDVLFAVSILGNKKFRIIFYLSIVFIVVPLLLSLYQLHKAIYSKWVKSSDEIKGWIKDNVSVLFTMSIITGSSFTAIDLCHSNLFNLTQLSIPLTKTEINLFKTGRIYSIIIFENLPQIGLQCCVLALSEDSVNSIVYISLIFSSISILITVLSLMTQKTIINMTDYVELTFDVIGSDVSNTNKCMNVVKKPQQEIVGILGINKNISEILKPKPTPNGLTIKMKLYISISKAIDMNCQQMMETAKNNGQLPKIFQNAWSLSSAPTIQNIQCRQVNSKQRALNTINIEKVNSTDICVAAGEGMNEAVQIAMSELININNANINNIIPQQTSPIVDVNSIPKVPEVVTYPNHVEKINSYHSDSSESSSNHVTAGGTKTQA